MDKKAKVPASKTGTSKEECDKVDSTLKQGAGNVNNAHVNITVNQIKNIPCELDKHNQWFSWKRGRGKNDKRPYNSKNMQPGSISNPADYSSRGQATLTVSQGKADGIGFVFTADDPYTFIDLDNCIDDQGRVNAYAQKLIDRFASYTEISQSGKGIHILVEGTKPGPRSKSGQIEMHDHGKYCALTGNRRPSTPATICKRQAEIAQTYGESFPDGSIMPGESDIKQLASGLILDLKATISSNIFESLKKGEKFAETWAHARDDLPSLSDYDLSLASQAVDVGATNQEIANLIIHFRRDHGNAADLAKALRPDYIARTIAKARSNRSSEYGCVLTDMGNASRFAIRHGENLRYCFTWNQWLIWDGIRWKADDVGRVTELAKETILSMYHQVASLADATRRKEFLKSIRSCENNARIEAMVKLTRSTPGIATSPAQFNTDPGKLNVENGTVDLATGKLLPHDRDDLITMLAPVSYASGAQSDLFSGFLERAIPDQEVRRFVQKVAGYSLYGETKEEILLFIYGPPASGKSTFLKAVGAALGDYATTADFGTFLKKERSTGGPRADIARLAGRRFVVSYEVQEGAKLDEALVNQLTGMDMVTVRHLYQSSFEFLPQFTIWLAANNRPRMSDSGGGIWRRLKEIPFDQVIPESEQNRELKSDLCSTVCRNAAFSWLVSGCLAWQSEGLEMPEAVKKAIADYKEEMDFIGYFLEDCTVSGPGSKESNTDLWNLYLDWCRHNRYQKLGRKNFTQNLLGRGLTQGQGGRGGRDWLGIVIDPSALDNMQISKRFLGHLRRLNRPEETEG